ncbi:MAG TPA: hypothetical protein DCM41_01435, partial [Synergistaceae bacterium]|nr:hypothetical protein [Synergistaceae bacterium]
MRRIHKRDGAVLITAIYCSVAILTAVLLYFTLANKIHGSVSWECTLLKRENAAVQAEAMVKFWFCSSVSGDGFIDPSEFIPGSEPKDDPYLDLPEDLLQEVRDQNKNICIQATVIDQNYSDSFVSEAEKMNVPKGEPSVLLIAAEGESRDICFIKRYHIRVTSAYSDEEG